MLRPLFTRNEIRRKLLLRVGTTTGRTWRFTQEVFRHGCAYCLRTGERLQRDHVIPLSRGGLDVPTNVVPACASCNAAKGEMDWRAFMAAHGFDPRLFLLRWLQLRRGA